MGPNNHTFMLMHCIMWYYFIIIGIDNDIILLVT
jgi:hypothetical protein